MKEIDFHPHALYKMTVRNISADAVIAAVKNPDLVASAKFGRKCIEKRHRDYRLRVILEEEESRVLVITTHLVRR